MGELKQFRPGQKTIPRQRPVSRQEMMDELADRIADENDLRARQRYDEIVNPQKYWSPEKRKVMDKAALFSVLFFVALFVFCGLLFSGMLRF